MYYFWISRKAGRKIAATLGALIVIWTVPAALAQNSTPSSQQSTGEIKPPSMSGTSSSALLETGFNHLYGLDFKGARADFSAYQKLEPLDPIGKAAEAASYLFEEFNTKNILSSDFFLNDDRFLKGLEGDPETNRNPNFEQANAQARQMSQQMLKQNPHDTHAMLVLTMADGMESDYDQVILKKQIAAVSLTRQAENEATTLLALDKNAQDAYVALGAGHYIIGCLPGYKRAFLWFGGVHGDKERGIEEMTWAANKGHYLQPFAKIMLALAFKREHQPEKARPLLQQLAEQFPSNPLFAHELALLGQSPAPYQR